MLHRGDSIIGQRSDLDLDMEDGDRHLDDEYMDVDSHPPASNQAALREHGGDADLDFEDPAGTPLLTVHPSLLDDDNLPPARIPPTRKCCFYPHSDLSRYAGEFCIY